MKLFSIQKIRKTVCVLVACMSLVGARGQGNVSYIPFKTSTTNNTINVNLTVGATEGHATVSNGAAMYKIPIVSAPRPSGTIPIHDLALIYNSLGGNGLAGKGWSISGAGSVISRSHKVISLDDITEPNCTNNEVFNLDGVRIYRDLNYATLGSPTEKWYVENEPFSEIFSYRDNNSKIYKWKVTTKDGVVMHYGESTFSRVSTSNVTGHNTDCNKSTSENISFYLDRMVYSNGNERIFSYTWDGSNRSKVIEGIYDPYGYHEFSYKLRSDVNKSFPNGMETTSDYLLDKIRVTYYNYSTNVRTYQLKYSSDEISSFLSEIQEEAYDGTKINPTIFIYSTSGNYVTNSTNISLSHQKQNPNKYEYISGDFNNDGLSDVLVIEREHNSTLQIDEIKKIEVFVNNSNTAVQNSSFTSTYSKSFSVGEYNFVNTKTFENLVKTDFNGDGYDDFLIQIFNSSATNIVYGNTRIYYSNGNGSFTEDVKPALNNTTILTSAILKKDHHYSVLGDFDGDGAEDYILFAQDFNPSSGPPPGLVTFFNSPKKNIINQPMSYPSSLGLHCKYVGERNRTNYLQAIDFDGDGRNEVLKITHWKSNVKPHDVTSIEVYKIENNVNAIRIYNRTITDDVLDLNIGDFNGDSKSDLLLYLSNSTYRVFYSTGNTFDEKLTNLTPVGKSILCSDFNNDGRTDILYDNNSIYYSKGYSFVKKTTSFSFQNGENTLGDFDGDGNLDVLSVSTNTSATTPYTPNYNILFFNKDCKHNMLLEVKDGLGSNTIFNYKNMTDNSASGIYSKEYSGSPYSTNPLKYKDRFYIMKPLWLVSNILSNSSQGIQGTSFKYFGGLNDNQGRGFLGFRQINVINDSRNLTTEFHTNKEQGNQFDEKLEIDRIQSYNTASLQPHYNITNKYTKHSLGVKRYHLTKDEVITDDYVNGWSKNTYTYQPSTGELLTETTENFNTGDLVVRTLGYQTSTGNNFGKRPALITSTKVEYIRSGKPSISYMTNMEYNNKAQLTKETRFSNTTKPIVTEFEYHNIGITSKVKVTGSGIVPRVTETFLDATTGFFIEKERNALGQEILYNIEPLHNKSLQTTGVDGLTTNYAYDAWGRLTTVTSPTYDPNALNVLDISYVWDFSSKGSNSSVFKEVVTKTNGATIKKYFDRAGRHIASDNQLFTGDYVTDIFEFNDRGLLASNSNVDKNGLLISKSEFEYDEFDRKTKILKSPSCDNVGPIEYQTTYNRTGTGRVITSNIPPSTTIPNGSTENKSIRFGGEVISSSENNVNDIVYEYDAEGKAIKTQASNGDVLTEIQYDAQGRKKYLKDNSGGIYTYEYNSLGDITKENNPSGYKMFIYDNYGRKKEERINEGTIEYFYYPNSSGVKTGKMQKITGYQINGKEEYDYDALGRLNKITNTVSTTAGVTPYITEITYNANSQIISKKTPTGNIYDYIYNTHGFLSNINRGSTSIYSTNSYYSSGALKDYFLGTTLVTKTYDDFQNIKKIQSTYINDEYKWDPVNMNLEEKKEHLHGLEYVYTYDNYERLTDEILTTRSSTPNHIEFHNNGNIDWKTSAGVYQYPANKRIFGVNMMVPAETTPVEAHSAYEQKVTYASFYRPTNISLNGKSVGIQYNTSFDRSCATFNPGGVSPIKVNRYYLGSTEIDYSYTSSTNTFKHSIDYIYAGDELVAMDVKDGSQAMKTWWVQTDYLGTIRAVFDNQNTVYFQNYDAWGVPRNTASGDRIHNQKPTGLPDWLYRGYTGHEHYYELGLINLGARLYDPHNSRMLSPDLVLHNQSMQGFNRYSYANNNPLKYVDPDGNLPVLAAMAIGVGIGILSKGLGNLSNGNDFFAGSFESWTKTVFVSAASALITAGIGVDFGAIGNFGHELLRAGAHGLNGGLWSELQGGSFLTGAASAGLGSLAGSGFYGATKLATTNALSYVFSGVSGGLGSLVVGGNFWEGAGMALIVHGLNHASNSIWERTELMRRLKGIGYSKKQIFSKPDGSNEQLNYIATKAFAKEYNEAGGQTNFVYADLDAGVFGVTDNQYSVRISNAYKTGSVYDVSGTIGHELIHAIDYYTCAIGNRNYYISRNEQHIYNKQVAASEIRAYRFSYQLTSHAPFLDGIGINYGILFNR